MIQQYIEQAEQDWVDNHPSNGPPMNELFCDHVYCLARADGVEIGRAEAYGIVYETLFA